MAPPLIPSALDPSTQAFPVLTGVQISRIRPLGKSRRVEKGEILFEPGDIDVPFFVLLSGRMEIVQPDLKGERLIATHAPGEFCESVGELAKVLPPLSPLRHRSAPIRSRQVERTRCRYRENSTQRSRARPCREESELKWRGDG